MHILVASVLAFMVISQDWTLVRDSNSADSVSEKSGELQLVSNNPLADHGPSGLVRQEFI